MGTTGTAQSNDTASAAGSAASPVHASCVAIGETGVLILGASGAGKTTLALRLLSFCAGAGYFARLVSDDLTLLRASSGRIIARSHPRIAGQYELRGLGVLPVTHEPSVVVRQVAWCEAGDGPRFPERDNLTWTHENTMLPMVRVSHNHDGVKLVLACIKSLP